MSAQLANRFWISTIVCVLDETGFPGRHLVAPRRVTRAGLNRLWLLGVIFTAGGTAQFGSSTR